MLTPHDIIGMSTEWPNGIGLVAIMALILILILFLLYQAGLKAHDVLFLDMQSGTGTVIEKTFMPERLNLEKPACVAFESSVLPACWELTIAVGEEVATLRVDERTFDAVKKNEIVAVEFGIARRSNAFLLKKVIL